MKFTLSWLRTHLETDATLDAITDRLTGIGLELESVTEPGEALRRFRVAHIVEAVPHPNADRLRACTVDTGDGIVSVVCGAPNARTGLKVVFAPPGAVIPGSGITLKIGEIRGVTSAGMLLSRREMGLGEDHDGILELPEDAPIGMPYPDYAGLDDPVIDIAVTPNRGDALSVRGVARDLAAAGLGRLKPWAPLPVSGRFESPLRWAIDDTEACPWVVGRVVRGLRNGPSPAWLQARLSSIGLRPINALVDVTNFFTVDLGRPLHVFDADRVQGGVLTFRHGAGESFRALNGRDYTADAADCVIADSAGIHSLAGVMGGEATGCTDDTVAVFIECALFDPVRVALTGRRHAIVSDARQRFERGIDPALLPDALEAATHMIQTLCGGEASTVVSAGAEPQWQRSATLRFERLAGLGGAAIEPDAAASTLERLGFDIQARTAATVTVGVPSWRNDVAAPIVLDQAPGLDPVRAAEAAAGCAAIEPEADLVEEVLRIHGLDAIEPVSLPRAATVPAATLTPRQVRAARARRTLAEAGLLEAVSFSFMQGRQAVLFGGGDPALRLLNPISADLDQLRSTPVASLALAAARNAARGLPAALLFEIGPSFCRRSTGKRGGGAVRRVDRAASGGGRAVSWRDGRQGGGARGDRGARGVVGELVGQRGCAGVVSSGAVRPRSPRAEADAGEFRRAASIGVGRARPGRASGGVRGVLGPDPGAEAAPPVCPGALGISAVAARFRVPRGRRRGSRRRAAGGAGRGADADQRGVDLRRLPGRTRACRAEVGRCRDRPAAGRSQLDGG